MSLKKTTTSNETSGPGRGDRTAFAAVLFCIIYFVVLQLSGCDVVDSPFGFVRGCVNHGIDWNVFMAPIGFLVMLLLPLSVLYLGFRAVIVVTRAFVDLFSSQ